MNAHGAWEFWRGQDRFQRVRQRMARLDKPRRQPRLDGIVDHLNRRTTRRGIEQPGPVTEIPTVITGVSGSGSALVAEFASRYLGVAAVDEGCFEFWLADQNIERWRLYEEDYFNDLLLRLASHTYFRFLLRELRPAQFIADALRKHIYVRSLEGIALGVLRFSSFHRGQKRLGHHDPAFLDNLPKLLHVLPDCRIVHVVRDPRDVARAILKLPWGANNAVVAASDWSTKVQAARFIGEQLGSDRYHEIRFEDLRSNPSLIMKNLSAFILNKVDPKTVRAFLCDQWRRLQKLDTDAWKVQLSWPDVERVESVAREEMLVTGYVPESCADELSWTSQQWWKLHHRMMQFKHIVRGDLAVNGAGKERRMHRRRDQVT